MKLPVFTTIVFLGLIGVNYGTIPQKEVTGTIEQVGKVISDSLNKTYNLL